MAEINPTCRIDSLPHSYHFHAKVDVLRLDLMHAEISGNKWFKLKFYLEKAVRQRQAVLTFGGAYSNHIVATAAAAHRYGLPSFGVIRGEQPVRLSHTLARAQALGMKLYFCSRTEYKNKRPPDEFLQAYGSENFVAIPEGGYGPEGRDGAREILQQNNTSGYTHLFVAAGTGTTLAGLAEGAGNHQTVLGVSVLKNQLSLREEVNALLSAPKKNSFQLLHDYHFGGYAKYNQPLIAFMNAFYTQTGIPTDFVYTAKAFYAALEWLQANQPGARERILLVHTGGLQGNASLPKGTLIFS